MRRAFTIVEMLIAMVLTLLLVTAIAQFYAIIGDTVKDGRAMIEVSGRMRVAVNRLNEDLENITVQVTPWNDDGSDGGYFEYFEGLENDYDTNSDGTIDATATATLAESGVTTLLGDGDDYLAFTIRSPGRPFTGRYCGPLGSTPSIYTSHYAEVAWWAAFEDRNGNGTWQFDEPRTLYRRQLLIRPDLTAIDGTNTYATWQLAEQQMRKLWQENDVSMSVRYNQTSGQYFIAPNTIADLSRREYRFAHKPLSITVAGGVIQDGNFPHVQQLKPSYTMNTAGVTPQTSYVLQAPNGNAGESPGEDVILSGLLAFDVQVYDPYVRLWADASSVTALLPSDPGYKSKTATQMTAANMVGMGGFVDLNYYRYLPAYFKTQDQALQSSSGFPMPLFADAPSAPPSKSAPGVVYDTWAMSYERDGIDQFADGSYDKATNGYDDDGLNGVDDANERETIPPYADPIRGIRVRVRVYEPSTRQARQATVAADFVTE